MGLSVLGRALLDGLCKMPLCLPRKVLQCFQLQCVQKPWETCSYLYLWSGGWYLALVSVMNKYYTKMNVGKRMWKISDLYYSLCVLNIFGNNLP